MNLTYQYNDLLNSHSLKVRSIFYFFFVIIGLLLIPFKLHSQNTWLQKAGFGGTARYLAVGFAIGNKGYVGTGVTSTFCCGVPLQDFWEYDPTTNIWTQKADVGGLDRLRAIGFSIGNKGYIGIGQGTGGYYTDFWEYNPNSNIWTRKADYPGQGCYFSSAFSIGSKGYVGLGQDPGGTYTKDFWEYDQSNNTWTQKHDFPAVRNYAAGFSILDKGYIVGGYDGGCCYFDECWEYNPSSDSWIQKSNVPSALAPRGFSIRDKGYIANSAGQLWEFNIYNNTWTNKAPYGGVAQRSSTAFSINDKGYFGIGESIPVQYQGLSEYWEYTPGLSPYLNTNSANNIDYTSANAGGTIDFDGNYPITAEGLVWSTSPNPTISSYAGGGISNDGTSSSLFSSTMSFLTDNTVYYYRAYATNLMGTSYGTEYSFSTKSYKDLGPNNGDANGDGIKDNLQNYVASILNPYTNKYITVVSLDKYAIQNLEVLNLSHDNSYIFLTNQVKFKVTTTNTRIKIYYHDLDNLNNCVYRKLSTNNIFFTLRNVVFSSERIGLNNVPTATFNISDGGPEDYDGLVNGSITDPGGPAILAADANIPIFDDYSRLFLIFILSLFGLYKVKKSILK